MTGSNGGGSTGSLFPGATVHQTDHGEHYGLPIPAPGLQYHEKTLLGLMGWWMAMNFIGIIYALMAVDLQGDGMFQKEDGTGPIQKLLAAIFRVVSLGVFATRPRPSGDQYGATEGGGKKSSFSNIIKFVIGLGFFLFLGILFPSKIKENTESFLGELPQFLGSKGGNKPGDIRGNAQNIMNKLSSENSSTSTMTKEHEMLLNNIKNRNKKVKQGFTEWEELFNNIDFGASADWESKVFGRKNDTYYIPKDDKWDLWRVVEED